jgi:hypothetical protein
MIENPSSVTLYPGYFVVFLYPWNQILGYGFETSYHINIEIKSRRTVTEEFGVAALM